MKNLIKIFVLLLVFTTLSYAQETEDTVVVKKGWNIIGALSNGTISTILRTEPVDLVLSSFYGYNPGTGYQEVTSLGRGKGYWVKVKQDGLIIFGVANTWTCGETISYEGKIYNTVQIGNQCWLKENLDVGTMIDSLTDQTDNSVIEKYCYGNDTANCKTYGGWYQWNEAMKYVITEGAQGICPSGWHIPTYAAYQTLITTVGGDGNSLKAVGQGTGSGAGTNTSGFSALLAGYRASYGFYGLEYFTYFWSSSENVTIQAYDMFLPNSDGNVTCYSNSKEFGFSVRCIKD